VIGNHYWSTGIKIKVRDGQYSVSLQFLDNGFCEAASTEGKLFVRYLVDDLDVALDTLKADAERLGIVWLDPGQDEGIATVYCEHDGELDDGDHPELRRVANEQAVRLGWRPIYSREPVDA
jgi:hypothetical protein